MDLENQAQTDFEKQKRPATRSHFLAGILILVVVSYLFGFNMGKKGYAFNPKDFKVVNQQDQPATVNYQTLWDAISVLNDKYIDKPVDQQKILFGAVKGAVEAVGDPYTTFFDPKTLQSFQTDLKGSFEGIGAEIGKKDNNIVIIAPLDDSPAKRAGLKAQDIILQVNGEAVNDWSVEQAVDKIRGPKGTTVTLSVLRSGEDKPFEVKIVRDTITVKSVKWEIKDVKSGDTTKRIEVITLSRFGDDTKQLFDQAVNDALTKGAKGIILDERNNPGGYLQTAVDLGSSWIGAGQTVVSEARSDGSTEKYAAEGNNRLAGIKTVVLINGGSASAAEILAGALQDYNIAELIGEKSFGKGSVQELVDLKEGGAVKVTIAKWITPNGKNLNKDGLVPNIEVKISDEDAKAGKDPQMDKAVEEVTK